MKKEVQRICTEALNSRLHTCEDMIQDTGKILAKQTEPFPEAVGRVFFNIRLRRDEGVIC